MSAQTNDANPPAPTKKLRGITYLAPSIPTEYFETILQYLESVLGVDTLLIRESRWSGPPADKVDPFTSNDADLGFFCSSVFLRMLNEKNQNIELCPVAACHQHPKALGKPVYFSDVITHKDNEAKYKTFHDLKGCKWAYNDEISLSGSLVVLAELKRQGTNATFFGNIMQSGSHMKSLEMVLNHTVDAAAIDSNAFKAFGDMFPEKAAKLVTITALGPMPIYPIVFNSRLPADVKDKITAALLAMNKAPGWGDKLRSFNVSGFVASDMSLYDKETVIKDLVKNMKINTTYY